VRERDAGDAGRDAGAGQAIVAGLAGKSQSAFDAAALAACHAQVDADGAIALGGRPDDSAKMV